LTASLHVPQDLDSLFKISDDGLILNSDENLPVNHQILLVGWDDALEHLKKVHGSSKTVGARIIHAIFVKKIRDTYTSHMTIRPSLI